MSGPPQEFFALLDALASNNVVWLMTVVLPAVFEGTGGKRFYRFFVSTRFHAARVNLVGSKFVNVRGNQKAERRSSHQAGPGVDSGEVIRAELNARGRG
jgi:hypothetical protein